MVDMMSPTTVIENQRSFLPWIGWDVSTVPRDPTRRMLRRTEGQSPMGFCHLTNRNANVELPRPQSVDWLQMDEIQGCIRKHRFFFVFSLVNFRRKFIFRNAGRGKHHIKNRLVTPTWSPWTSSFVNNVRTDVFFREFLNSQTILDSSPVKTNKQTNGCLFVDPLKHANPISNDNTSKQKRNQKPTRIGAQRPWHQKDFSRCPRVSLGMVASSNTAAKWMRPAGIISSDHVSHI